MNRRLRPIERRDRFEAENFAAVGAAPLGPDCALFHVGLCTKQRSAHPALLEMSVILREADSSILSTTRQGMEQAAADLNVELRFLSPTADNSAEEQIQLLQREVEAGASAILLIPADRTSMADAVSAAAAKSSLVTLETDMTAQGARGCISVDNAAVGQILGQAALNGVSAGGTVLLLDSAGGDNGIREQLEAAAALLEAEDRQVLICRRTENLSADLTAALSSSPVQAIVAFEASALERAVEVAQSSDRFPLLYGTGSTSAIAAGLEENDVTAIVAHNAFSAGYLAVQHTAALARNQLASPLSSLPFTVIRQETMYLPDNQKLLFPVV